MVYEAPFGDVLIWVSGLLVILSFLYSIIRKFVPNRKLWQVFDICESYSLDHQSQLTLSVISIDSSDIGGLLREMESSRPGFTWEEIILTGNSGKLIVESMGRAKGKFVLVINKMQSFESIDWLEEWLFNTHNTCWFDEQCLHVMAITRKIARSIYFNTYMSDFAFTYECKCIAKLAGSRVRQCKNSSNKTIPSLRELCNRLLICIAMNVGFWDFTF